jgi:hypothetical protein
MDTNPAPVTIDDDVEWLTEQIEALKQLGRQDEVDEGQKYDFSIRWGTAMAGRLRRLVHYSARGVLADADERRFQALCDELNGLSDLIDRIGLARPDFTPAAERRPAPRPTNSRHGLRFRRG